MKTNTVLFNAQLGKINQVWTHIIAPDGTVYIAGLQKGTLNSFGAIHQKPDPLKPRI